VSSVYALAFQALYRSCQRRSNKLHRLEAALQWHMARGVLQVKSDCQGAQLAGVSNASAIVAGSAPFHSHATPLPGGLAPIIASTPSPPHNPQSPCMLQQLVHLAARDGNAPVLSMLLSMFEGTKWQVRGGVAWRATGAGPGCLLRALPGAAGPAAPFKAGMVPLAALPKAPAQLGARHASTPACIHQKHPPPIPRSTSARYSLSPTQARSALTRRATPQQRPERTRPALSAGPASAGRTA
jgi:hypothetical protein